MTASAATGALPCLDEARRGLRRHGHLTLLERGAVAPPPPARAVARPRLVRALADAAAAQVVALVAPAGYGKTTLLGEWAAFDERPFAWVALDPAHNDPRRLEASLALAVERMEPEPGTGRIVLVLDGVEALHAPRALAALAALVEGLPPQIQLALASRRPPALPIARWRAQGRLTELGPPELALDLEETGALLRMGGLEPSADEVAELRSQTEGWPAAVALAALSLGDGSAPGDVARFGGDDRLVADYLRWEVLDGLRAEDRRLLLETSILDELSGPLCDPVLDRSGSAAALSELARQGLVIPLDRSDERFRHHELIAATLHAELRRREPGRAAELHRRASRWYADAGDRDRAIRHAAGAGEVGDAAELVWSAASAAVSHGRRRQIDGWLGLFGDAEVAATPLLALARSITELAAGRGHVAEHWARTAAGAGSPPPAVEAGVGLVRATLAREGLARMREDAERAFALESEASPQRATCRLLSGTGALLASGERAAIPQLREGARRAAVTAPLVHALCLTQLAVAALAGDEWDDATELAARARAQVERYGLGAYPTTALVFAASALVRAHRGRIEAARQDYDAALRLRGRLTDFAAWYDVELGMVLARVAVRLSDVAHSRSMLVAASRAMAQLPDARVLAAWLEETWSQLDSVLGPESAPPASLTTAELRILRYLPTHLSFREIAERVYVSANTVKTQANAVYRKLDASCRSEAVGRARELGLLDA